MSNGTKTLVEHPGAGSDLTAPTRGAWPHPAPEGFVESVFDRAFRIRASWRQVWTWLEDPRTFSGGQIWPYRVEFLAPEPDQPAGFHEGGLNIHHGPC